ncbi:hypothetical protein GGR55DRAFT_699227 [Xylaria sp. FL0064]|nr:hypothetical protein GGR55DRAFT_699227 [Xylaria sp. FL0064]
MHSTKFFLFSSFAIGALAQNFTDACCSSSWLALEAAAPQPASYIRSILPDPVSILKDPAGYASSLCEAAAQLPASELSGFEDWGQSLLSFASVEIKSYDALIPCFATGYAVVTASRYINSIVSQTAPLCQETGSATGGSSTSTGAPKITSAPTL